MAETTYLIQSRPPVRAFVIAALCALVGAGLLVLAVSQGWHVAVTIIGAILLACGVALAVAAGLAMRRLRVYLTMDEDGYSLVGQGEEHVGDWLDVNQVTRSGEGGGHVIIYHGPERRTHLFFSASDPGQIDTVLDDLRDRLKASRRRPA